MASVTIVSTNDALVELSTDGAKWLELPFVGTVSATGAEAPETEVNAFRGSGKISGRERVASLSLNVASYVPNHRAWRETARASRAGQRINWRITTKETIVQAAIENATVAVDTAGLVALDGTAKAMLDFSDNKYAIGQALQIGKAATTKLLSVDFIGDGVLGFEGSATANDKGVMYVSDPAQDGLKLRVATAITASADYKFVIPAFRLGPFLAAPSGRGNFEMAVEAAITASTTLVPAVQPEWSMHIEKLLT